jgi:hypothetical protein
MAAEDLALAKEWLSSPSQVFLLIGYSASEPPVATFFFREGDAFFGDVAFLEFPFDADALAPARPIPESSKPAAAAAPPRTVPFPQMRHTAVAPPAPAPAQTDRPKLYPRRIAAALLGIAVLGASLYLALRPKSDSQSGQQSPAMPGSSFALGLNAERQKGDVKLTWSRQAAVVAKASSAVMTIRDGGSERRLLLDQEQIRSGSLLYMPAGTEFEVSLAINSPIGDGAESLIVVLPKSGEPLKVQAVAGQGTAGGAPPPSPPAHGSASRTQPARPFIPPAVAGRAPNPPGWVPPPVVTAMAAPAVDRLDPQLRRTHAPAVTPPEQPAPPAETAAPPAQPPRRISSYVPPRLMRQAMPMIPQALRPLSVASTVEIRVSIDETGKVTAAEAGRQPDVPRALVEAARNAAWLCRFEPAKSGGVTQKSEMLLRFQFTPSR